MLNRISAERLALAVKYKERGIPGMDGWSRSLNPFEAELTDALIAERKHSEQLESRLEITRALSNEFAALCGEQSEQLRILVAKLDPLERKP